MKGNSPWAARVPPTTGAVEAPALVGWRLTAARATAPIARVRFMNRTRVLTVNTLPFVGGWAVRVIG